MRNHLVLAGASILGFLVGCGSSASGPLADLDDPTTVDEERSELGTTTVHGVLAEPSVALDNARAIAISGNETRFWTFLNRRGEFTLQLPAGESYRIVFANQLPDGGQVKFGHLNVAKGNGHSEWFGANQTGTVELGNIALARSASNESSFSSEPPPPNDSAPWNGPTSPANDEWKAPPGEGDWACHRDDSVARTPNQPPAQEPGHWNESSGTDTRCNVCNAGANKPLFPSIPPGESWNDRHEGNREPGSWNDDKTCASNGHIGRNPDAPPAPAGEGGWTTGPGGWSNAPDEPGNGGWTPEGSNGGWGGWPPSGPQVPSEPTRPPEGNGSWTGGGWMGGQPGGNEAGARCSSANDCSSAFSCIAGMCQTRPR